MAYVILKRDDEHSDWEVYGNVLVDVVIAKSELQELLEDYSRENVMLCVVKDFGMKVEVEL